MCLVVGESFSSETLNVCASGLADFGSRPPAHMPVGFRAAVAKSALAVCLRGLCSLLQMATSEHSDETGSNRGSDASTLRSRPHTARQGGSASIICRPAASSTGSGNTFLCKKCLQTFPVTERDASRFGSCAKCGTAYKGLTDRWKINRSLKVHYDANSDEDRAV